MKSRNSDRAWTNNPNPNLPLWKMEPKAIRQKNNLSKLNMKEKRNYGSSIRQKKVGNS